jgi:hypothetical protein
MKLSRVIPLVVAALLALTAFGAGLSPAQAATGTTISLFAEGDVLAAPQSPVSLLADLPGLSVAKKDYACSLVSQSPKDWTKMKARQDFDARWTVLNTGSKTWTTNGTDYKYIRGAKLHTRGDVFDMPKNVAADGKIALYVDMMAPKDKGTYVTYWGLANGSSHFCQFYMIITVK